MCIIVHIYVILSWIYKGFFFIFLFIPSFHRVYAASAENLISALFFSFHVKIGVLGLGDCARWLMT